MSQSAEAIIDVVFFGFAGAVFAFAALRTERFFRILAYGQERHMPSQAQMKIIQFLAGACAIGAAAVVVWRLIGFLL